MALRDPLVTFAIRAGNAEASLVRLAEARRDERSAAEVFAAFSAAANDGSPFAACICCRLCKAGHGTEKSASDAFNWATKASLAGFAPGFFELGACYEEGIGVPRDVDKALELYQRSAIAQYGFAAFRLGMACYNGEFAPVDVVQAVRWMERAYELGDTRGAHALADWYESGEKLKRDDRSSLLWYKRASELGDPLASFRLQMVYTVGELGLAPSKALASEYAKLCKEQSERS
jgi:hypothetical protein